MPTAIDVQEYLMSSTFRLWVVLSIGLLSYLVVVVIYRLFLHPLAQFPGPKIAASTYFYEFCWDFYGQGAYLFQIEKMHLKYGKQ